MNAHEWARQHEEDLETIELLLEGTEALRNLVEKRDTEIRLLREANAAANKMIGNIADECKGYVAEIVRLKEGNFTKEEIHNICHNLHGTVGPEEFADGCRKEMEKLYGFCPWSSQMKVLALSRAELEAKAASLERRLEEYESQRARDEGR